MDSLTATIKKGETIQVEFLKIKTQLYAAYKKLMLNKNTSRLKLQGWKIYLANTNQKKSGWNILAIKYFATRASLVAQW